MKSIIKAFAIAALVAAPLASFAQSSQPVTRAQVREELAQLEKAGYNPNDWLNYPFSALKLSSRNKTATTRLTAPIPAARRNRASRNSAGSPGILEQAGISYESRLVLLQLIPPSPASR
jgi:hypothetical protein